MVNTKKQLQSRPPRKMCSSETLILFALGSNTPPVDDDVFETLFQQLASKLQDEVWFGCWKVLRIPEMHVISAGEKGELQQFPSLLLEEIQTWANSQSIPGSLRIDRLWKLPTINGYALALCVSDDQWTTPKQRYELADSYKREFLNQLENQLFLTVEKNPFLKSYKFIKGSDLLDCSQFPLFSDIKHKLIPYESIRPCDRFFLSHRWLSTTHPDPNGRHFKLLQGKINLESYYWIDYCCLPQGQRTDKDKVLFKESIARLPSLMFRMNFAVLRTSDDDYFSRAWCFFELLAANVIGNKIIYLTEQSISKNSLVTGERKAIETALLQGVLPKHLRVTKDDDLQMLRKVTDSIVNFFKLRLIENYMKLAQDITDQSYFFGEDPYYFLSVCDFSRVVLWAFKRAKRHDINLMDLCRMEQSFFTNIAKKEHFQHKINPYYLPPKVILDQSRLKWLIANKNSQDSASNLFYILTSMIE